MDINTIFGAAKWIMDSVWYTSQSMEKSLEAFDAILSLSMDHYSSSWYELILH